MKLAEIEQSLLTGVGKEPKTEKKIAKALGKRLSSAFAYVMRKFRV